MAMECAYQRGFPCVWQSMPGHEERAGDFLLADPADLGKFLQVAHPSKQRAFDLLQRFTCIEQVTKPGQLPL